MSKPHLSGSKTVIFGATGGIGRAIAVDLAHNGKAVHLAGRDADALKALADEISAPYTVFDALDTGSINSVIAEATSDEPVDGLVWAVGSILLKPLSHLSDEDFLTTYHLNVVAPLWQLKPQAVRSNRRMAQCFYSARLQRRKGFQLTQLLDLPKQPSRD